MPPAASPEAPAPWHEDPDQIRALTGPSATVDERWFTVAADSPESFVELLERHSAPFILGARSLGARWARGDLLKTVRRFTQKQDDDARHCTTLSASYLVTTVPVPAADGRRR